jgi:hypothetical protein
MEKTRCETGSICAAIKSSCGGPRVCAVVGGRGAGFGRFFAISGAPDSAACGERVRWLRGEGVGFSMFAVTVKGYGVGDEGVAEEVEVLAGVAQGVRAPEVERVVELAVDGLDVVAAGVEPVEVGIG